jgi:two-component sensor histidine kinase
VEAAAVVVMNISDNGVGLPQDFDLSRVNTLGLRLVRQLTRQIKGTMSISSHNGTAVRVEFPVQEST